MTSPPSPELLHLGSALRQLIRANETPAKVVARRLGVHPGQLSRSLRGRRPLHVEFVFRILEVLKVAPWAFFGVTYRLAAERARLHELRGDSLSGEPPVSSRELLAELARRSGSNPPAAAFALKAGRVLRRAIERHGLTQRQVAREIGMAADGLGEVLRGKARLNFEHVFPVLDALGWTPARFFLDLFAAEHLDPIEAISQGQLFDDLEGIIAGHKLDPHAHSGPDAAEKS